MKNGGTWRPFLTSGKKCLWEGSWPAAKGHRRRTQQARAEQYQRVRQWQKVRAGVIPLASSLS
jgi:hypothetical protein